MAGSAPTGARWPAEERGMNATKLFHVLVVGAAALTTASTGCGEEAPDPDPTGAGGGGAPASAGAPAGAGSAGLGGAEPGGAAGSPSGAAGAPGAAGAAGAGGATTGTAGTAGSTTGACVDECATQAVSANGQCMGFPCCWESQACCAPCCAK